MGESLHTRVFSSMNMSCMAVYLYESFMAVAESFFECLKGVDNIEFV